MTRAMPAILMLCVAGVALLAVRVFQLSGQLERAEQRLSGAPASAAPAAAGAPLEPATPQGLEPRLAAVEKDLRALRDDLRTLEKATESTLPVATAEASADPRQILSVVKGESERIRDRHLDFMRGRWSASRKAALDRFAVEQKLEPEQKTQVQELLDTETAKLAALLRRPEAQENPEQVAADWSAALRDTDRAAQGVLEPQQVPAWTLARTIERRVLWPWLPED
jgi:hypothetical protein